MKKCYYERPTFKLCRGSEVPLLNFEGDPWVPLLNFMGVPGHVSQGPKVSGSWPHFYTMLPATASVYLMYLC